MQSYIKTKYSHTLKQTVNVGSNFYGNHGLLMFFEWIFYTIDYSDRSEWTWIMDK